jgi:hypothetical protein
MEMGLVVLKGKNIVVRDRSKGVARDQEQRITVEKASSEVKYYVRTLALIEFSEDMLEIHGMFTQQPLTAKVTFSIIPGS